MKYTVSCGVTSDTGSTKTFLLDPFPGCEKLAAVLQDITAMHKDLVLKSEHFHTLILLDLIGPHVSRHYVEDKASTLYEGNPSISGIQMRTERANLDVVHLTEQPLVIQRIGHTLLTAWVGPATAKSHSNAKRLVSIGLSPQTDTPEQEMSDFHQVVTPTHSRTCA